MIRRAASKSRFSWYVPSTLIIGAVPQDFIFTSSETVAIYSAVVPPPCPAAREFCWPGRVREPRRLQGRFVHTST